MLWSSGAPQRTRVTDRHGALIAPSAPCDPCRTHRPCTAVDIWSGNHPFFQGVTTTVVTDEGRVNRFKRRFAGLDSLAKIETMASQADKKQS